MRRFYNWIKSSFRGLLPLAGATFHSSLFARPFVASLLGLAFGHCCTSLGRRSARSRYAATSFAKRCGLGPQLIDPAGGRRQPQPFSTLYIIGPQNIPFQFWFPLSPPPPGGCAPLALGAKVPSKAFVAPLLTYI